MKRRTLWIIALVAVVLVAVVAGAQQQRRGPGNGTPPVGTPVTVNGTVVSFTATSGGGMPALVVSDGGKNLTFVLGPYWFLQNAGFEAAAGDVVEVSAIACAECQNGYAVISVRNVTKGTSITLRGADGLPLWQSGGMGGSGRHQRAAGRGAGNRGGSAAAKSDCEGGPDMARLATFAGTVKSFTGGLAAGRPTLVLTTAEGEKTFIVAPYRSVSDSGLKLDAGTPVTLTAAPSANDEWVVVSLKDSTGAELVLRDATTGLPLAGGMGRGRGNGRGTGNCGRG